MGQEKGCLPHVEHEGKIERAIGSLSAYAPWYDLPQKDRDEVWGACRWLVDATHGVDAEPPPHCIDTMGPAHRLLNALRVIDLQVLPEHIAKLVADWKAS